MNLPTKIISVKSLMKSWGMTFYDVFLMACIYNLRPVYHEGRKWEYWDEKEEDWMDLFLQQADRIDEIYFLRSDVNNLEHKIGKPIAKSVEIIDEESLLKRWDISQIELWSLEEEYYLEPVDPMDTKIEDFDELENHLIRYPRANQVRYYFRLSDIDQVERKRGIDIKSPDNPKSQKLRPSKLHKERCKEVAKEVWKKNPEMTIADMAVSDEIANACYPKTYAEKTIRDWIKDLCPNRRPGRRPKKQR